MSHEIRLRQPGCSVNAREISFARNRISGKLVQTAGVQFEFLNSKSRRTKVLPAQFKPIVRNETMSTTKRLTPRQVALTNI